MTENFFLILAAILIVPLIPAYIIYKFLPASDTDVSGPYSGLSLKLKGAFAGYFLLVIVGLGLQYVVMNNKQQKQIETLTREASEKDTTIAQLRSQISASSNPIIDWHIKGAVSPVKDGTRFFYDDGTTNNDPDGSFDLIKREITSQGKASPPKWMCIYNVNTGFKVISLNRDVQLPDIATYNIAFDDNKHEILIRKPIDINSNEKDSVVAVANFIEKNPTLKTQVLQIDSGFFNKAKIFRDQKQLEKARLLQISRLPIKTNNH